MRDRTKEVERLKRQLQQLQGALGQNGSTTPPPEQDPPNAAGHPSHHAIQHNGAATPPGSSHRMGEYVHHQPSWPHSSGPEHVNGLGLTTDGETPLNFDTSFFPQLQSSSDGLMTGMATPPSSTGGGRRPRTLTNSSVTSNGLPSNHHLRSSSTGPLMMTSACSSPMPHHQWQPTSAANDRRESLQVGAMSTSSSPLLPRESFSMCSSPEEVSYLHSKPAAYAPMDDSMAPGSHVYPPPPDSTEMHHPHSSPLAASAGFHHLSTVNELPEVVASSPGSGKSIPETTAPLLHFAIASGQIDTLRLLLARPDINLNGRDNTGYTPLQRAVCNGRTGMAALLLERGAIVDGVEDWMQMHQEAAKEQPTRL